MTTVGNTTTRHFETEAIAESAANLARVMGYKVKIYKVNDNLWLVCAKHTPQVDINFQNR